jgi:hypothetical protein
MVVCAALLSHAGCLNSRDPSIVYQASANPQVRNGCAHDVAHVPATGVRRVVVPASSEVRRVSGSDVITVRMKKTLGYMGHPVEPVTIDEARRRVGCAYKHEGDELVFSTFGEHLTTEGGMGIDLAFLVPEGIEVARADGLDAPDNAAGREHSPGSDDDAAAGQADGRVVLVGNPDEAATSSTR